MDIVDEEEDVELEVGRTSNVRTILSFAGEAEVDAAPQYQIFGRIKSRYLMVTDMPAII